MWSDHASTGGLGQVSLEALGNTATSLRVRDVPSPGLEEPADTTG